MDKAKKKVPGRPDRDGISLIKLTTISPEHKAAARWFEAAACRTRPLFQVQFCERSEGFTEAHYAIQVPRLPRALVGSHCHGVLKSGMSGVGVRYLHRDD
ncbi:hypothetical protein [Candidatus Poriferisocius sp.]|uniref:hypothetical protein n=1 Tax=Candidatus Poriferisocius sp. TaxID=3101276 RepID=UPI003B0283AD